MHSPKGYLNEHIQLLSVPDNRNGTKICKRRAPTSILYGSPPGEADHHLFHLIFCKVNDYHLLRVLALLYLVQTSMDDRFMVRSNGVLTFVYFYQLGKNRVNFHAYFLFTFTNVARFEINVEALLFACVTFFINWLRYKISLGLRTVSWSVKTKADHS